MRDKNEITNDNEATEAECCEEVDRCEELKYAGKLVLYGELLVNSLEVAKRLMEKAELMPFSLTGIEAKELERLRSELQFKIALTLFDKCTRLMPAQDNVYALALKYVGLLMKEKEADMERSEELRTNPPPFARFMASNPFCKHPGLKMIYDHWKPGEDDVISKSESILAGNIIAAMTIKDFLGDDVLMCPQCRALLPLEKVKSGELWEDSDVPVTPEPPEPAEEPERVYADVLHAFRYIYGEDFTFDKCVVDRKTEAVTFWTYKAWDQASPESLKSKL